MKTSFFGRRACATLLAALLVAVIPAFAEKSLPVTLKIETPGAPLDVRFAADGSKMAVAVGSTVCIYGKDGKLVKRFGVKDGPDIDAMDYANGMVATFAYTNPADIMLWKDDGTKIGLLGAHPELADDVGKTPECETAAPYRIRFSRDGKYLALVSTTDNFGGVKIWDVSAKKVALCKGYDDTSVYGLCLSLDGSWFATYSRDEQLKTFDFKAAARTQFSTQDDEFDTAYNGKDVGVLADGGFAVLKSGELSLWGADGKRKSVVTPADPDATYNLLRTSPDGKFFAVAFEDAGFAVYTSAGKLVALCATEDEKYGLPLEVTGLSFSPDGTSLAASLSGDLGSKVVVYSLK